MILFKKHIFLCKYNSKIAEFRFLLTAGIDQTQIIVIWIFISQKQLSSQNGLVPCSGLIKARMLEVN